jgi:hypothetical protein
LLQQQQKQQQQQQQQHLSLRGLWHMLQTQQQ